MIFDGMHKIDALFFHQDFDPETENHAVIMERDLEEGTFRVSTCCYDEWEWKFKDIASNYELVKNAIMDVAFDAECMEEAMEMMDEVFEEYFDSIVMRECEHTCNCENGCNCCNCE